MRKFKVRLQEINGEPDYLEFEMECDHDLMAGPELLIAAPDHALILSALVSGLVRIEQCRGGELDEFGCPVLSGPVRAALTKAGKAN